MKGPTLPTEMSSLGYQISNPPTSLWTQYDVWRSKYHHGTENASSTGIDIYITTTRVSPEE